MGTSISVQGCGVLQFCHHRLVPNLPVSSFVIQGDITRFTVKSRECHPACSWMLVRITRGSRGPAQSPFERNEALLILHVQRMVPLAQSCQKVTCPVWQVRCPVEGGGRAHGRANTTTHLLSADCNPVK